MDKLSCLEIHIDHLHYYISIYIIAVMRLITILRSSFFK